MLAVFISNSGVVAPLSCVGNRISENMLALAQTIPHLHFRFGHGHNVHWYEFVLLPLAVIAVYPDKTLRWLFPKADKIYQLVLLELAAIGLLVAGNVLLMQRFPGLVWWMPLALVLFCLVVRVVLIFAT